MQSGNLRALTEEPGKHPDQRDEIPADTGAVGPIPSNRHDRGAAGTMSTGEPDEAEHEIGTACYLCYGQCVNLGVHGTKGRPCSNGFSELVDRRRKARMEAGACAAEAA